VLTIIKTVGGVFIGSQSFALKSKSSFPFEASTSVPESAMKYYQIEPQKELAQTQRAVDFYADWADIVRSGDIKSDYLKHYYARSLGPIRDKQFRFRALFFASRLQPVLSYVESFNQQHGRAPYMLDLGCGFGLESLLICATGAKVHGLDYAAEKIASAPQLQRAYEEKHNQSLEISFERANLFDFKAAAPYDAVYSSATLHHIEPADRAIQAVAQLIAPGGTLFLSDENGLSPVQQLVVQKRIGWTSRRKLWRTTDTGARYCYGNENIRAAFLWARFMRQAGLLPQLIKYCRFLPPINWSLERLLAWERRLRGLPVVAELGAIGFLLIAAKPPTSPEHPEVLGPR
jgi:2-polyprenyl-3-methyl-5-hydroxy-6-metoxy-1,4-benzoquinol methylase